MASSVIRAPRPVLPVLTPHPIPVSEDHLLRLVELDARRLGVKFEHYYSGQCALPGFPDLGLYGRWHECWELKSITGTLSPAQQDWRRVIVSAGVPYCVFTPLDWASGAVQARLLRLAGTPPPAAWAA